MVNSTSLRTLFATATVAVALAASPASADISLKGKRVQLIVASGAGGGTDRIRDPRSRHRRRVSHRRYRARFDCHAGVAP